MLASGAVPAHRLHGQPGLHRGRRRHAPRRAVSAGPCPSASPSRRRRRATASRWRTRAGAGSACSTLRRCTTTTRSERRAQCFRTTDGEHPGVARLYGQADRYLAGPVTVFERQQPDFPELHRDPRETRALFTERGWRRVVGFQTRNPIHRAHEYLTKCALETVDGLLIHPLVGETKSDDVPAACPRQGVRGPGGRLLPAGPRPGLRLPGGDALRRAP